ncbi:hypothetical protein ACFC0D_29345 [Streptomyces sp. NPDC056222]|uniref:hypothetical protein n=1 Tax=Streptomyces sp. NPDC056222 TaxID=3345749 RepID=UPI0035DA350D
MVDVQRERVVGDGGREGPEQRHVRAVRAQFGVELSEEAVAGVRQSGRSEPAECGSQLGGGGEAPVQELCLEGGQAFGVEPSPRELTLGRPRARATELIRDFCHD